MRFLIAKKSAINPKNRDLETPKRNSLDKSGQPGGMRGATGEGTMGRGQRSLHEFCMQCEAEFCRMLTCVRHALPRLEARGGGSLTRIPPGQGFRVASFANFYQNRTNMGPKSTTNGTSLGQGGGKGQPKINKNMKNIKKRKRKEAK